MFPRSTHETFAQKLYQTFKNHKRFTKPKLSQSDFTICHYAGDVSVLVCIATTITVSFSSHYVLIIEFTILNVTSNKV